MEINERILDNDYPVFWDYYYVCDDKVVVSNIQGTVLDLKRDLKCKEVKSCDIEARRKTFKPQK